MNPINQYSPMQSALALLQPTVSYAQKRADADRNLTIQSAITQQSRQETEMAKQQAELVRQNQAQLATVPFLPQDQDRWRGLLDQMKGKIRERVEKDFGGDHEAYAKSMLETDMQQLALDAQKSPLYSAAQGRRSNYLQAQKDASEGKIYRPVTYTLANGEQKTASFEQAYLDFANYKTEQLPYNGGFKVDGKWRKLISDQYSPRIGVLGKFKPDRATRQEIASALVTGEGLTGADAMEYLRRTEPLMGDVMYKFEARNPYEEERLRQGWANYGLGKERNALARDRNKILKDKTEADKKASPGQIDWWDATFDNPDNIITRTKDGQPGTVDITVFDSEMKPGGNGKLQGFSGKVVGGSLLESTGAVYDKKTGMYKGAGGEAYVTVKNSAGGLDLRSTDLTGLNYETIPGNVYRYPRPATEYERATGRQPVELMQEQTIRIRSDEARKAQKGGLFRGALNLGNNYSAGYSAFGNADTPTGKGAYKTLKDSKGDTVYEFKILQPVKPTMIDRVQPTIDRMNTQTKTGQAVMTDADDDLNYIY